MFSVRNVSSKDAKGAQTLKDISFDIKAGEILGIAGVSGNGQSELLELLSGIEPIQQGSIIFADHEITADSRLDPAQLREFGMGHIPEDRHQRGLILPFTASECSILGYHNSPLGGDGFLLDSECMEKNCTLSLEQYDIRPANPNLIASGFSGGNQQKIVVARELNANPKVLLVGQPTRGVDIGAIEFIHKQLLDMRDGGCAILLVSVELDEILTLSDRILVMNNGQIVGEANQEEADPNRIGMMMAGIDPDADANSLSGHVA
jgi:simple sugar transport system ATP-binding protein